jgi:CRISPR/Cas system-associated protein Cas7 (RAMP superfamily)
MLSRYRLLAATAAVSSLLLMGTTLPGCEDNEAEEAVEEVEDATEDMGEGIEDAAEETGDEMEELTD